jgi:tetratricopeptide (TPR) repeat protein
VAKARKREHRQALELFYSALSIETDAETESRIRTNIVIAQTALGRELFQANRIEEAFASIRAAFLSIQDKVTRRNLGLAYGNSGIFYLRSHTFDLAAQMFERAEDSGVVLPEYLNDYGVCLVFLGRINEAIQTFQRVLGIEPQNDIARVNLTTLSQMSTRELPTPDLDTFADQLFVPLEDLADFDGRIPEEMAWRNPSISAREFAFA